MLGYSGWMEPVDLETAIRRAARAFAVGTSVYPEHAWAMAAPTLLAAAAGALVLACRRPRTDLLLVGGWIPCGLAWGVAAVHVHGYDITPMLQGATWTNAEMTVPSEAMGLTKRRLEEQARASMGEVRADGAVAIRLDLDKRPQSCGSGAGILVDGLVLGTGVVRYGPPLAPPSMARNLRRDRERSEP